MVVQNRQGGVKNSIGNVKPKNLQARPMDMNKGGGIAGGNAGTRPSGAKGKKLGQL